jgi:hypothetical protein
MHQAWLERLWCIPSSSKSTIVMLLSPFFELSKKILSFNNIAKVSQLNRNADILPRLRLLQVEAED